MSGKERWRNIVGQRIRWSKPTSVRRTGSRVVAWFLAGFAVYLMILFGSLVVQSYHMEQQVAVQEQAIQQLTAEQQALKDRLAFVKSDAAVELRARDQLDMARPDEVVLQLTVLEPTPTPPITSTDTLATTPLPRVEDDPTPNWRRWWNVLFNS